MYKVQNRSNHKVQKKVKLKDLLKKIKLNLNYFYWIVRKARTFNSLGWNNNSFEFPLFPRSFIVYISSLQVSQNTSKVTSLRKKMFYKKTSKTYWITKMPCAILMVTFKIKFFRHWNHQANGFKLQL